MFNQIHLFVFVLFLLVVMLDRTLVYRDAYLQQSQLMKLDLDVLKECQDEKISRIFSQSCTDSNLRYSKGVAFLALEQTYSRTHSCITFPCTDLFLIFLNSWVVMVFVGTATTATICVIYTQWRKKKKKTKEIFVGMPFKSNEFNNHAKQLMPNDAIFSDMEEGGYPHFTPKRVKRIQSVNT